MESDLGAPWNKESLWYLGITEGLLILRLGQKQGKGAGGEGRNLFSLLLSKAF